MDVLEEPKVLFSMMKNLEILAGIQMRIILMRHMKYIAFDKTWLLSQALSSFHGVFKNGHGIEKGIVLEHVTEFCL